VQLNSVERLDYYIRALEWEEKVVEEGPPAQPCPADWPSEGLVQFEGVCMRYDTHLPYTLKGLTLTIPPHTKVGVVGRTGSGKSSLWNALFRMADMAEGRILVDGVDCAGVGLKELRSRLAIIPQDPILFSGTVRSNMDPFSAKTDAEIWRALEQSGLKEMMERQPAKLETVVHPFGENFSVGERQLLCLCRALLKEPAVIVLDECTANVDLATDALIQASIRHNFRHATVLTIAHRLATVMDYDLILVLQEGRVEAYDSPRRLLQHPGSVFHRMVHEDGEEYAAILQALMKPAPVAS
jgi:ABC-type multidrug transport system fused ATPase/permease subunit